MRRKPPRRKRYIPDQADRDTLTLAAVQGVTFTQLADDTWCWHHGGSTENGFLTRYHAARDALKGLARPEDK